MFPGQPPLAADSEDLYDEAHWTDQTQGTQSVKPSSGGQVSGGPPEVVPQATLRLQNVPPGKILSLDQAIHFSIDCACENFTNTTPYGSNLLLAHSEKISTSQTQSLKLFSPHFPVVLQKIVPIIASSSTALSFYLQDSVDSSTNRELMKGVVVITTLSLQPRRT